MADEIRALAPDTWDAFSGLVERHGGIFGGCWCTGFHADTGGGSYDGRKARKKAMVEAGETHAALVFRDGACIGWAQYGRTPDLPRIKNRPAYDRTAAAAPVPDWRITCFFIDRQHRKAGVAATALNGAVRLIARAGGGRVEGYPEAIEGQKTAASFLWCGTLGLFERAGFTADRKIGLHRWVVWKEVAAA